MLITTRYQKTFKKQILLDYYLEFEKRGTISILRDKSIMNIENDNDISRFLKVDDNYLNAFLECEKINDKENTIFCFLDDNNGLLAHAVVYEPEEHANVAFLKKIYVRNEENLNEVVFGNFSPLQCIYFKMLEFIKVTIPNNKTIYFDEEAITEKMLEVLKEEQIDYCKIEKLEEKAYEKDYDKYEWSNFTKKRKKSNK